MSSIIIQRGQIWDCYVPYGDGPHPDGTPAGKFRPVVILGWTDFGKGNDQQLLVAPCSTFSGVAGKALVGDVPVPNPTTYSLRANTFVRARRVTALQISAFKFQNHSSGTLPTDCLLQVLKELEAMLRVTGMVMLP